MLKAIFFDLDDTLLATDETYREALADACVEAARQCPDIDAARLNEVYLAVGREMWLSFDLTRMQESAAEIRVSVWREALRQVGIEDPDLVQGIADHYGARRRAGYRLFPDVLETLNRLHRRYHLGIITNGLTEVQHDKVRRLGIEPYFDTVLVSQEAGIEKPDPRIFRMALERVPCEPHEAAMIGDSPDRDIAGARAVGMHALWVRTGKWRERPDGTPVEQIAHAILDRLEALLPWLERQAASLDDRG